EMDAPRGELGARLLELPERDPLHVLAEGDLFGVALARGLDGPAVGVAERLRPRAPALRVVVLEGAEERVVEQPPRMLFAEASEVARALGVRIHALAKVREAALEPALLERPHEIVPDPRRAARGAQEAAVLEAQGLAPAERAHFLHVVERDVE